jgi:hypothetical protein
MDEKLPMQPKASSELLNMRKIIEQMTRQKEYGEAHKIQQKAIALEKDE